MICCTVLTYLYYAILFYKGLRSPLYQIKTYHKVSIVIAARNEEKNISNLLTSLVNQTYPQDKMEIIIADDSSTDQTAETILRFAEKWPFIKLLQVYNRDKVISPKKNCLQQAIDIAQGDIILTTDADCILQTTWVDSVVANYSNKADMVAGYSRTYLPNWKKASLVQKFEHFDFMVLLTAASGAILSGKPFSCTGQNLSFRKKKFYEVGGYQKISHILSGDDVNLMQLFRKAKAKITFSFYPTSFAYTQPIKSWTQLLNQRSRWASNLKKQITLNTELFLYLISVFLFYLAILVSPFINWILFFLLVGIKAMIDYFVFKKGAKLFLFEKERMKFFPIWFIIQPFYSIIITVFGTLKLYSWHNRR